MNNLRRRKQFEKISLSTIIVRAVGDIQNGSVTIIKQDNTVIQVNLNEKITLENDVMFLKSSGF
ncbi:MAG TPA: DUF2292 domain-containing protein [Pseudobacteroides sp.]|uniref:DUF2292 domain-containing protein n=1 Tax=Pseudobacteroides sp. TaxID=1968840 RepID=UPI002F91CB70